MLPIYIYILTNRISAHDKTFNPKRSNSKMPSFEQLVVGKKKYNFAKQIFAYRENWISICALQTLKTLIEPPSTLKYVMFVISISSIELQS